MNTPALKPQAHHPFGPSSWPAWAECADYEGEKDDIDEADTDVLETEVDGDDAKGIGILMHEALAKVLTRHPEPFAKLSHQQEQQVRWAAETAVSICEEHGYSPDHFQVEQRLSLIGPDFKEVYFGTGDIVCGPLLFDLKTGDERNYIPQLIGYAFPLMERMEVNRIYGILLYSRYKRVRRYTIDRQTAEAVTWGILGKRQNPDRKPVPCSYCGFCAKRGGDCTALNGIVSSIAGKRADWKIALPHASARLAVGDPILAGALRLVAKRYVEKWAEGIDYLTRSMAENGIKPLGFRVQREKGRVKFISGKTVVDTLAKNGVSAELIAEAAHFSMSALKKAWMAQNGGSADAAEEKLTTLLTAAGTLVRGDPILKLVAEKGAEEMIAAALARTVTPTLNPPQ